MYLGRIWGIELYLNIFFLFLLGLFFAAGVLDKGLLAFGIVLIHELTHVLVARRLGLKVKDIELLPFGGVSHISSDLELDPRKELYVAIAGPASNLALVFLSLALKKYGFWSETWSPYFLQCNLVMAGFNLLPALPLDGGRVYRAYLGRRIGLRAATYQASKSGQIWAVIIIFLGTFSMALGYTGFDISLNGLFLFYAASREKNMAPYLFIRHLTQKKNELFRTGILGAESLVTYEDVTLGEIIRPFVPQKFHLVLVLDRQWQYKGMVTEAKIIDGLLAHGLDLPVSKLME